MDLLRGNIKTLYFKYLSAAFGSALISIIYGIVDMAMVGQYRAPTARRRWPWSRRCGTSSTAWAFSWASAAA